MIPTERVDTEAGLGCLRGIHAIHGGSHNRAPNPRARKNGRHPNASTTVPPTRMPTAGPRERPAINKAFGKPRRLSGKYVERTLE
jgi:hypothetical protein